MSRFIQKFDFTNFPLFFMSIFMIAAALSAKSAQSGFHYQI
ncbi:unnamed protein product [Acidocella sp. C78]|nr:unnamed protein product [Acidocella sp. C78]